MTWIVKDPIFIVHVHSEVEANHLLLLHGALEAEKMDTLLLNWDIELSRGSLAAPCFLGVRIMQNNDHALRGTICLVATDKVVVFPRFGLEAFRVTPWFQLKEKCLAPAKDGSAAKS